MSDPVPFAPSRPVPPQMVARLDSPVAVQEAVTTVLQTCHAWQPVAVPYPKPGDTPASTTDKASTVEASVCDFLDGWPHHGKQNSDYTLSLGVSLGLAAAVLLLILRRALRILGRTQTGWWLRATYGEAWRDIRAGCTGVFLGCAVGLTLVALKLKAGLNVSDGAFALFVVSGAAGAVGMVRLRRSEQRRSAVRWQR